MSSPYRNADWKLPEPRIETWEQVGIAVLIDIRAELKELNSLLSCPNFLNIPRSLSSIDQKLTKPKRRKKMVAKR